MKNIFFSTLFIVLLCGCSSVPVTGRKQLSIVSASQMNTMAVTSYQETLKENKLSTNVEQTDMIKRVGARISKAVERYMADNNMSSLVSSFQWEFNLIDDPNTVNAWCMPGGKVAFYTGILPVCKDETGVAVVMGHEIAHAVANHGGERMSHELAVNMGETVLSAALNQKPEETQQLALAVYGVGSQVLGILPYSRLHESEADKMGLIFMAMAGYDPNEAPKFWERMRAASGGASVPLFLSTHPSDSKRISDLQKEMPKAMQYYKPQ
jgi:predicted Zn-dependent protease